MRFAVAVISACFTLIPTSSWAFSGPEHHDVTNIAYQVALRSSCTVNSELCTRLRELLVKIDSRYEFTLTDVTVAVDWFQGTAILTDKSVTPAEMNRREPQFIWRLLAAHQDRDHFQKAAIDAYKEYHDVAMAAAKSSADSSATNSARSRDRDRALYCEAVALHFMEDFLAAGHVATPRTGFHDVVSASVHDHYNHQGIGAEVKNRNSAPWASLLTHLAEVAKDTEPASGLKTKPAVTVTETEVEHFRNGADYVLMKGDDHLQGDDTPSADQKIIVILLAARSIQEVLESSSGTLPAQIVRPCFEPWSARPNPSTSTHTGNWDQIRPGSAGYAMVPIGEAFPAVSSLCADVKGSEFLTYHLADTKMTETSTSKFINAPGLEVIASSGWTTDLHHPLAVIDVGGILFTEPPRHSVHVIDPEDDHITPNTYSSALALEYATGHISFLRGDGYKAIGALAELAYNVSGTTASLIYGVRRYSRGAFRSYRFDWGGKVAFGFQIINLNITLERGHRYSSDNIIRQQTFVSPGIDLQIPSSLIEKALHSLKKWGPH